jgi:hypothetical protein
MARRAVEDEPQALPRWDGVMSSHTLRKPMCSPVRNSPDAEPLGLAHPEKVRGEDSEAEFQQQDDEVAVQRWEHLRTYRIAHALPEWSNTRLEDAPDQVLPRLLDAFWKTTGASPTRSIYAASAIRLWRRRAPAGFASRQRWGRPVQRKKTQPATSNIGEADRRCSRCD